MQCKTERCIAAVEQLHKQVKFHMKYQSTRRAGTVMSSLRSMRLSGGQKATITASGNRYYPALQSSAMHEIEQRREP
jgi:hypothetical protein